MDAKAWRYWAELAQLSDKLANLPEVGGELTRMPRPVASSVDELAQWSPDWGVLAVEVAQWKAVAAFSEPEEANAVRRHVRDLKKLGFFPDTLERKDTELSRNGDSDTAVAAYRRWAEAGRPGLDVALHLTQEALRSEVIAASARIQGSGVLHAIVSEFDHYNAEPLPLPRTLTAADLHI